MVVTFLVHSRCQVCYISPTASRVNLFDSTRIIGILYLSVSVTDKEVKTKHLCEQMPLSCSQWLAFNKSIEFPSTRSCRRGLDSPARCCLWMKRISDPPSSYIFGITASSWSLQYWYVRNDTQDREGGASQLDKVLAARNRAGGEIKQDTTAVLHIWSREAPTELHELVQNSSV